MIAQGIKFQLIAPIVFNKEIIYNINTLHVQASRVVCYRVFNALLNYNHILRRIGHFLVRLIQSVLFYVRKYPKSSFIGNIIGVFR
jgi:hypothetical protein